MDRSRHENLLWWGFLLFLSTGCGDPTRQEESAPASNDLLPDGQIELEGVFIVSEGRDGEGHSTRRYFLSQGDTLIRLRLDEIPAVEPDAPIRVGGAMSDDEAWFVVSSLEPLDALGGAGIRVTGKALSTSAPAGSVAVFMILDQKLSAAPYHKCEVEMELFGERSSAQSADDPCADYADDDDFPSLRGYFDDKSYGRYHVAGKIYDWYPMDLGDDCDKDNWLIAAMEHAAETQGFVSDDYRHAIALIAQEEPRCQIGEAYVTSSGVGKIFVWENNARVFAHELGHSLGWWHANTYSCRSPRGAVSVGYMYHQCIRMEYGDRHDLMGYGAWGEATLNSHFRHVQGWLNERNVAYVRVNGEYTVVPHETSNDSEVQSILVSDGTQGDFFHIELQEIPEPAVLVRLVRDRLPTSADLINVYLEPTEAFPALRINEPFRDPKSGVSIELVQLDTAPLKAHLLISVDGDSCRDGRLNGNEGDVDCGVECNLCDNGKQCTTHVDCKSLHCEQGVCSEGAGGLTAMYHNGIGDAKTLNRVDTDAVIDFEWGKLGPGPDYDDTEYFVRWSGYITPRYTESYTFHLNASNATELSIGGATLISNDSDSVVEKSGTIQMKAGQRYPIELTFSSEGAPAKVQLLWSGPSQPKEVVPRTALEPSRGGLLGLYYKYRDFDDADLLFSQYDYMIAKDWGRWAPTPDIFRMGSYSMRWRGRIVPDYSETYTLSLDAHDHVRVTVDGDLLIDSESRTDDYPLEAQIDLIAHRPVQIIVDYMIDQEKTVEDRTLLTWESPSQPRQPVPGNRLIPDNAGGLLGDVDFNGVVNIVDALMLAQYYVGLDPKHIDLSAGDVNMDGTINIVDALIIAQYYVNLVTELPPRVSP